MFTFPNEGALPGLSRVQIRFSEALYFLEQFKCHCGSADNPRDSSFHWIAYSDAFLMALLSVQDLVGPKRKRRLLMGCESLKREGKPISADYTPNPLLVLKLELALFGRPARSVGTDQRKGSPPSMAVCTTAMTSPASGPTPWYERI